MIKFFFFISAVILITGCFSKSNLPKGILSQDKMQAVLWDVIKANEYADKILSKDSSKDAAVENAKMQLQIFELHKTTKDEFYRSNDYYQKNVELMLPLVVSLTTKARNEKITMPENNTDTFRIRNKHNEKDIQ